MGTVRELPKAPRRGAASAKGKGSDALARAATESAGRTRTKSANRSPSEPDKPKRKRPAKLPAEVAQAVAAALDKKAQDLIVLDLRHTPAFTDFFVLCSGLNQRQVKAIADAVEESLRTANVRPAHTEGYDRAEWVLMDFFTFIVHVFTPQTRAFYALERLWGDAERIEVAGDTPRTEKRA